MKWTTGQEKSTAHSDPERAEGRHLALFETLPVQAWTARPDGALDYVNTRVCEYFGRTAAQMIGAGWKDVVHAADLPEVGRRWGHSLSTGEPYNVEFRLQRTRDRQYRWHIGCALPVRDAEGAITGWVGTNTDIDDQKRATEIRDAAVERAEVERDRLLQVIENAPAAMAIYRGPNYEISVVNRMWEQFTGKRNVVGMMVGQVFPELEGQELLKALDRTYETGQPYEAHEMLVLLDRDGSGRPEETFWNFVLQPLTPMHHSREILLHAVEVTGLIQARQEIEALRASEADGAAHVPG